MNNMNGMNQNGNNNNGNEFALNYQPNDILQKEFKTKMRGYDPNEVDQFLDGIIKDYETFTNEIGQLKAENESLMQSRNMNASPSAQAQHRPQVQNRRPQPQQKPVSSSIAEASTNYDILRRLSNLEKRVFGHDFANGVPENNNDGAKQFASAVVPNNMNNHDGVESGHTEINPNMNNGFNNQNNFQGNRPMNGNSGQNQNNFNNNNNFNRF
ncbi:Cell cycle protein GpsB [Companilactobacillus paralimentarius]